MSSNIRVTYSDNLKSILWSPMKTGSKHAEFIFGHFDFVTSSFNSETDEYVQDVLSNHISHHHNFHLLRQHKDYDVICTTRNPYERLISGFFYFSKIEKYELTSDSFKRFFIKQINNPTMFHDAYVGYPKIPKYFLKTESLYDDYIKIPFVRDSKLNQCGLLYDLCNKKINNSVHSISTKDFFTMDMIDYFYDNFKNLFDIDGYEKDSYKQFN